MFSYNVFPLINIATRITENTATCLDHVWYNGFNTLFSGAFVADISDHYPVFAVLNFTRNNRPLRKTIRDLSLKGVDSFISAMPPFVEEFNQISRNLDINSLVEWFSERLMKIYDKYCPKKTKTVSYKRSAKPWLTKELIQLINYKHRLFKRYKLGIVPFSVYKETNNSVSRAIKRAKSHYFTRKLNETRNDIKQTWRTINYITKQD